VKVKETKLTIYNKLKENGFPLSITHTSSDYNPVTEESGISTTYETYAIQTKMNQDNYNGVQISDFKLLVPAIDNNVSDISLKVSDVLTRPDGSKISVFGIQKTEPTGENLMFTLFCHE